MKIDHGNRFGRAVLAAGFMIPAGLSWAATTGSENYRYDASGNLVEKSIGGQVTHLAYDSTNRLLENGPRTFSYDSSNRLVSEHEAAGESREWSYGYADKVLGVTNDGVKTDFLYNAAGQMVGKISGGTGASYAWDGLALAEENGRVFANEEHFTGGVPVIQGGGEVVVSDHMGTTLLSADHQFESTAFGEGQESGRFTGKIHVDEMGGYLFPCRLYTADSGRWATTDPSGYPDGTNNYSYVNGDPITRADPTGLVEYVWDPTSDYAGLGVFSPKAITTKVAGTVKVNTIDKGNNHYCYQPVVDKAFEFKGGGHIKIPTLGYSNAAGYTTDATFRADVLTHETWHKTHRKTLGDKTYGALETWSASYAGNEFATAGEAMTAGTADFAAAKTATDTKYAANTGRSGSHEGANPASGYYETTIGGVKLFREQNPDWGQPLDTLLGQITVTFTKTAGNCEY
ncbi:RHS repeat-associated core domain-containing protein [Luteolibacter ambystomatis]|uniref:RHS repeat-associated core domain-containing protein n=1 Tax=Luteolibacter ambystomatis TaxID=2824561 RepID=A0A975J2Q6_9BACT|nr:RHS repeat-associated core domain-containing protein [Luteolibacter ambystomatis]QUE52955.1 RHS repeat-associated core domain-containing protein [Luteolibacter ambystomatis]